MSPTQSDFSPLRHIYLKCLLKADDPAYRATVADVTRRLDEVDGVTKITGPYGRGSARGPTSKDGHSVLVSFEIPGDYVKDNATLKPIVDQTLAATEAAQAAPPDFNVEPFGHAFLYLLFRTEFSGVFCYRRTAKEDTIRANMFGRSATFGLGGQCARDTNQGNGEGAESQAESAVIQAPPPATGPRGRHKYPHVFRGHG